MLFAMSPNTCGSLNSQPVSSLMGGSNRDGGSASMKKVHSKMQNRRARMGLLLNVTVFMTRRWEVVDCRHPVRSWSSTKVRVRIT